MWIEIKQNGIKKTINFKKVTSIYCDHEMSKVGIWSPTDVSRFYFDDKSDMEAFYEGIILALNGLDYFSEDNYIKPLLQTKNEALHRHLMLKEALSDRK